MKTKKIIWSRDVKIFKGKFLTESQISNTPQLNQDNQEAEAEGFDIPDIPHNSETLNNNQTQSQITDTNNNNNNSTQSLVLKVLRLPHLPSNDNGNEYENNNTNNNSNNNNIYNSNYNNSGAVVSTLSEGNPGTRVRHQQALPSSSPSS